MYNRLFILLFIICLGRSEIVAQEIQATVRINHSQIQGTDASVFDNLQQTLEQFINEHQWTALQFQDNERITCNFNITVTKYEQSDNRFTCNALIQANRPVYNSAYTTTIYKMAGAVLEGGIKKEDLICFLTEGNSISHLF